MTETVTQTFCERCGTRYTFEHRRSGGLARLRAVSKGLREYVLTDHQSLGDAMADAHSTLDLEDSLRQLDTFQKTFSFCLSCRQYVCVECWNPDDGRCRTCAPMPGDEEPEPELLAEPEAEMVAEREPELLAEPEPEAVAEPEPVHIAAVLAIVEPVVESGPEPIVEAEPEPEAIVEPRAEPEPEPEPIVEPEAEAEPEHIAAVLTVVELVAEPEPIVETEAVAEPEPEAVVEPEPEAVVEPELEAVVEQELERGPEPEPEHVAAALAIVEPELEAVVEPEPEPVSEGVEEDVLAAAIAAGIILPERRAAEVPAEPETVATAPVELEGPVVEAPAAEQPSGLTPVSSEPSDEFEDEAVMRRLAELPSIGGPRTERPDVLSMPPVPVAPGSPEGTLTTDAGHAPAAAAALMAEETRPEAADVEPPAPPAAPAIEPVPAAPAPLAEPAAPPISDGRGPERPGFGADRQAGTFPIAASAPADAASGASAWPAPRSAATPEPTLAVPARQSGRPGAAPPRVGTQKACVRCGLQLAAAARFCSRCGTRQDEGQPAG